MIWPAFILTYAKDWPEVIFAHSYDSEVSHGLLYCYYLFIGSDVMLVSRWIHVAPHTCTIFPLTTLLLAAMFQFMTSLIVNSSLSAGSCRRKKKFIKSFWKKFAFAVISCISLVFQGLDTKCHRAEVRRSLSSCR